MQGSEAFERFAAAGMERLGLEADEAEVNVMRVADSIYGPHIDALLAADFDAVDPEQRIDLSRAPSA
jgi:hypothetical protein